MATAQQIKWAEFENGELLENSEFQNNAISPRSKRILKGELKISNGIYSGDLMRDPTVTDHVHWIRHGCGTMTYFNNNMYVGDWRDDKFDGFGEYVWSDGRRYIGSFVCDKIEGKGTGFWPDGRIYEGEYKSDLAHGHGLVTLPNGRYFEGVFEFDFPVHGELLESDGTVFLATFDGKTHLSEWKPETKLIVGKFDEGWEGHEKLKLYREFVWNNGSRFAGSCRDLCPLLGVLTESNGDQYLVSYDGDVSFSRGPRAAIRLLLKTVVSRQPDALNVHYFQAL
jgi:hypothetical protein